MVNVLIWQFHKRNCSYSLSIVNILGEQLYTFALSRMTFGTTTFSKELLFRSTSSLNFLLGYCSFWKQLLLRWSIWSITFLWRQHIFFKTPLAVAHSLKKWAVLFKERSSNLPFVFELYWLLLEDQLVVTRCHWFWLVVPIVITRYTSCLSFYKRSDENPFKMMKMLLFQLKSSFCS